MENKIMDRMINITNLAPNVDIFLLSSHFSHCGNILSAKIDYDENFQSLCTGQIIFQEQGSAQAALRMNDTFLAKNHIKVHSERKTNFEKISKSFTKIFVKNIPLSWDDCDLIKSFEKFGDIANVSISLSEGKSNGYGFVGYKQHSSASNAAKEMDGKVVENNVLRVKPFVPKELRRDSSLDSIESAKWKLEKSVQLNNLHVKNLPKDMDDIAFRKLFEQFGEIMSFKLARNERGENLGYGFVAYKLEKDAGKARFRMNGYSIGPHILEVNFNQKKEHRQNYLQILNSQSQEKHEFGNGRNRNKAECPIFKDKKKPNTKNNRSRSSEVLFSFSAKK